MNETNAFFQAVYRHDSEFGNQSPPWDIDGPQPVFVDLANSGKISGEVLDAGFGPAGLSLYLATEGYAVTGIDQSPEAVDAARARARQRGLRASFAVGDLLDLSEYRGRFGTVVECGVFHGLGPDERRQYARSLHVATRPGAHAHLLNLTGSGQEAARARLAESGMSAPAVEGFHAVTAEHLRAAFAGLWDVVSIEERAMKLRFPGDQQFTELPAVLSTFKRRPDVRCTGAAK
ncbi:hypothetical protein AQ490_20010 [Wenjunlia vitaminophila]|uniref:Methyl transferase n=1 Tax=Wenjunlia vitaminophila TaxID=76728 RepID=A3R4R3_WENVI|nr:class I SAM-dependent methyltransferase [Wenjunlia vitaminophila]ABO15858.1 methyl transferase [Wenjunlia vitaminophila]KRV49607.1 hypothetical protein AQ490_20010 [Wenjunlia vitaminophila]